MTRYAIIALLLVCCAGWARADDTVINSKHDLSKFGPGPVRALDEDQVCIFCHVPHNASAAAPLWNRYNPTTYYRIYRSDTMQARVDQPGPQSKLCLSCHDGSIALGLTLDRPITDPIPMTFTYMPSGPTNLTNDLSDDHPVGFRYDRMLANRDPELRAPELVDHRIHLGQRGELECTACHDPHNNRLGDFLRLPLLEGALCNTCHQMAGWRTSAHAQSPRTVRSLNTDGTQLPYQTMADNACRSCHASHTAPFRAHLLYAPPSQLCVNCHDGIGGPDVLPVLNQRSGHRVNPLVVRRDPERRGRGENYAACTDCHNPHAVADDLMTGDLAFTRQGPLVPPAMREVPGITLAGLPVETARYYYEVCFRCHSDFPVTVDRRIIRQQDSLGNVRRQFLPTAASAHPIAFPARNINEVPSLLPEYRTRDMIGCQDCHNNPDSLAAGGTQVNGPHTSRFAPLLVARYESADYTSESPQAYALCYTCHDRTSILNNESFALHERHVVRGRTPCSACHTAHGVSGSPTEHGHLINFDLSIVSGQRLYLDTGTFSGTCTLRCHSVNHVNFTYSH